MNPVQEYVQELTRRHFFSQGAHLLGGAAIMSLMGDFLGGSKTSYAAKQDMLPPAINHLAAKAKHVIYLHMVGGPPQMDMFDHKPSLKDWYDKDLPESIRSGQRLTTMTSGQSRLPVAPSVFKFAQHGQSGMWVTDLLPWTSKMVDDMCFIRSMHTDAINHEPAITYIQTGNQISGRPCLGSWVSYGLGSLNQDLPTFVVLVANPSRPEEMQAISSRLWSSGYLPGQHAGVSFRSKGDPILFINNPPGVSDEIRRDTLTSLNRLNEISYQELGDPDTRTRIKQYELAYRLQSSVPELTRLSDESAATLDLYGSDAVRPGTFANSVLMARRLVERGVRFVQIYLNSWDTHHNLVPRIPSMCKDIDQGCYGLVQDLKQRGMLDETLVIWGGEFGRTVYSQELLTAQNYGRDHHPRCFTMWMAGGGTKPGMIHGETDEFSYNIVKDPVHVRDFQATMLHLLGFDHERFTYRYQGLDQRLTGVEHARVVQEILA